MVLEAVCGRGARSKVPAGQNELQAPTSSGRPLKCLDEHRQALVGTSLADIQHIPAGLQSVDAGRRISPDAGEVVSAPGHRTSRNRVTDGLTQMISDRAGRGKDCGGGRSRVRGHPTVELLVPGSRASGRTRRPGRSPAQGDRRFLKAVHAADAETNDKRLIGVAVLRVAQPEQVVDGDHERQRGSWYRDAVVQQMQEIRSVPTCDVDQVGTLGQAVARNAAGGLNVQP